jgi:hypothetical protein
MHAKSLLYYICYMLLFWQYERAMGATLDFDGGFLLKFFYFFFHVFLSFCFS